MTVKNLGGWTIVRAKKEPQFDKSANQLTLLKILTVPSLLVKQRQRDKCPGTPLTLTTV